MQPLPPRLLPHADTLACGFAPCPDPYLFYLKPGFDPDPACLRHLLDAAESRPDGAIFEARQLPYENPKLYDPVTLDTSWASLSACLIRRDAFEAVGGFSAPPLRACEDVDLSWRLRAKGYRCYYVPRAVVRQSFATDPDLESAEQAYRRTLGHLFLLWRYGSAWKILGGYGRLVWRLLGLRRDPERRHAFKGILWRHLRSVPAALRGRRALRKARVAQFLGWDYEYSRSGKDYPSEPPAVTPLVSVVIRTYRRPTFLREALWSVAHQTYPHVEAIVVEDGSADGEAIVNEFEGRLTVRYLRLPPGSGRLKTGNAGVAAAQGDFVAFLDDDDLFFADHLETLVAAVQRENKRVAYSIGIEAHQRILSADPLQYRIEKRQVVWQQPFDRLRLFFQNFLPIQSVLFDRRLFQEVGGLDESLSGFLEDWDLWLRFALKGEPFAFVPKATSEYRRRLVSSEDRLKDQERQQALDAARRRLQAKYAHEPLGLTVADVHYLVGAIAKLEAWSLPNVWPGIRLKGLRWVLSKLIGSHKSNARYSSPARSAREGECSPR